MGDVVITHAETGAVVVVPDSALSHYRLSGWTTLAEAQELVEHQARSAERNARQAEQARKYEAPPRSAVAKKAAGGGD